MSTTTNPISLKTTTELIKTTIDNHTTISQKTLTKVMIVSAIISFVVGVFFHPLIGIACLTLSACSIQLIRFIQRKKQDMAIIEKVPEIVTFNEKIKLQDGIYIINEPDANVLIQKDITVDKGKIIILAKNIIFSNGVKLKAFEVELIARHHIEGNDLTIYAHKKRDTCRTARNITTAYYVGTKDTSSSKWIWGGRISPDVWNPKELVMKAL